jgi:hypothetical protein
MGPERIRGPTTLANPHRAIADIQKSRRQIKGIIVLVNMDVFQYVAWLYAIIEREFINTGESVFKVGFTTDLNQRMKAYPNGSILQAAFTVQREKARDAEKLLLKTLNDSTEFRRRLDIGREYFEGPLGRLETILLNTARLFRRGETDQDAPDTESWRVRTSVLMSNDELVRLILPHCDDIVFSPEVDEDDWTGLYVCDSKTNIWSKEHFSQVEETISRRFREVGSMPGSVIHDRNMRYVVSCRGRDEMVKLVATQRIDRTFKDKLDTNLDILAFSDGRALDFSGASKNQKPIFRDIKREDYVRTTTGWAYDADAAREHRAELEEFLEKVLPIPEERRVVLTMFAHFLSGHRWARKFMVFTDRRGGDNGKSVLLDFFRMFMGDYATTDAWFMETGDNDFQGLRGKRLVVADTECSGDTTLNVATLKKVTDGAGVKIKGRKNGNATEFSFTWQTGIVMIFNEKGFPQFDKCDESFLSRMMVVPMRSKFVYAPKNAEQWTYPQDTGIRSSYSDWLSSLADVLVEHYASKDELDDIVHNLPTDMESWRTAVCKKAYLIREFMAANLEITGNNTDYVLCSEVKTRFFQENRSLVKLSKDWTRAAKEAVAGWKGVTFKDTAAIKVHGSTWKPVRNIIYGVRYATPIEVTGAGATRNDSDL